MSKRSIIKCWDCGKEIKPGKGASVSYRQYCDQCWEKYKIEKDENTKVYAKSKIILMHERALRILEKQDINMYAYQEPAEVVLNLALSSDRVKFRSSDEVVAAMEFLRNYIKIKVQWPVGNYIVDFLVEPMKAVVEIDGHYHDNKKVKDNQRDIEIRRLLGKEWEIIRIPTKYIESNVQQLVPAVKAIYNYKRELRNANNGIIPEMYSDRERTHYEQLLKGMKKRVRVKKEYLPQEDY